MTETIELCGGCGAAVEEVLGELRHQRTHAKACDLDDPSSLMAQKKPNNP